MHTMSANHILLYCRHHHTIEHSSLDLHLYHTNTYAKHKEIGDGNKKSNVKSTLRDDNKKIFKNFHLGDYVMVQIYPKRISSGTIKMLHARSTGPCKILNKLNYKTYVIDLLRDYDISYTFNINDLVDYKGFDCNPCIDKPSLKSFS